MLPSRKSGFFGYLRVLRPIVRDQNRRAEELALEALRMLVNTRYPLLKRRLPKRRVTFTWVEQEKIARFVEWLESQETLEAAFWLSSLYACLVTEKSRQGRSLFFTPPELSRRLIENLSAQGIDFAKARVIDPACGGAAFLAPVAIEIRNRLRARGCRGRRMLIHLEKHVAGWDMDATLCKLSAMFLSMAVYADIKASGYVPHVAIHACDSLKRSKRHAREYDVVLCNPPYRKVSAAELRTLQQTDRALADGQANYYAIFMIRALSLAKGRGHVGLITPSSFLSGKSFGPLRKHLAANAHLKQIDLVDKREGVFVGVEQEAVLTVFCRRKPTREDETSVFSIGTHASDLIGVVRIRQGDHAWILPRNAGDVDLLPLHREGRYTLETYGYQCRTGLYVPHRDRRRVSPIKTWKEAVPLIWSTDIGQDGKLRFEPRPQGARFIWISKADRELIHRRPGVALQRTTSSEDTRRLVASPIGDSFLKRHGGYVGENHVIFLLKTRTAMCSEALLTSIIRSRMVDRLFRCLSGSVAVSLTDLVKLPLPDPAVVKKLLKQGLHVEDAVARAYRSSVPNSVSARATQRSDELAAL
jgi:adenine-specific DNA-methyltransferase